MEFEGKWLVTEEDYKKSCIKISENLNGFKRNSIYSKFVGNDLRDKNTAILFYNFIEQNYPFFLEKIDNFLINDRIGNPKIYEINGVNISPGTLRFIKVLGDILTISPNVSNIIEIGSGYGGQCLITKTYLDVDYSVVDIPESLLISKKYLNENNCDVIFINTDNIVIDDYYDLVISDYCLSELDMNGIYFYINEIVKKCKSAYITANATNDRFDKLISELNEIFSDLNVSKETPKTSEHDNYIIMCKNNKLI